MNAIECDCGKGEWCPEFGFAFKAAQRRADLDRLAAQPAIARERLRDLTTRASRAGVTFTPAQANRLVAISLRTGVSS